MENQSNEVKESNTRTRINISLSAKGMGQCRINGIYQKFAKEE